MHLSWFFLDTISVATPRDNDPVEVYGYEFFRVFGLALIHIKT